MLHHTSSASMKKKSVYAIVLALALLICVAAVYSSIKHELGYSLAYTYTMPEMSTETWRIVSDTGFWTKEMYAAEYESAIGASLPEEILIRPCSYVVCYGYTLEKLYYKEDEKSGRFTSDSPYYYAHAVLKPGMDSEVNVYRVEDQIRIDRDPHTNTGDDTVILQ